MNGESNEWSLKMTLFLALLLPTLARRGYWQNENNSQQFSDLVPGSSRSRSPLLPETEQFLKSVSEFEPVSCRDELIEEFDIDLLLNGIRVLIDKGNQPKNILAMVVKAVESYPLQHVRSNVAPTPKRLSAFENELINTRMGGRVPSSFLSGHSFGANGPPHRVRPYFPDFLNDVNNFPPKVRLEIQGLLPTDTYQISVDIMPFMSINDVIQQSYMKYSLNFPGGESNPFDIDLASDGSCYIVKSITGEPVSNAFEWMIIVFSKNNELKYEGKCIPSSSVLSLKSGDVVRLQLKRRTENNFD